MEVLCQRGVDMNITDNNNNSPLWQALDSGQEDIAHTLVKKKKQKLTSKSSFGREYKVLSFAICRASCRVDKTSKFIDLLQLL